MPATLWYNLCSTGRCKLLLGRWSPLKQQKVKFFLTKCCHCFAHFTAIPCLISVAIKHLTKSPYCKEIFWAFTLMWLSEYTGTLFHNDHPKTHSDWQTK
jgi:hypothetical protein